MLNAINRVNIKHPCKEILKKIQTLKKGELTNVEICLFSSTTTRCKWNAENQVRWKVTSHQKKACEFEALLHQNLVTHSYSFAQPEFPQIWLANGMHDFQNNASKFAENKIHTDFISLEYKTRKLKASSKYIYIYGKHLYCERNGRIGN